jgi:hypothetical protein
MKPTALRMALQGRARPLAVAAFIALATAGAAAAGPRGAAHRHAIRAPRAETAPSGVLLSPGDRWREVADAPASPVLGATSSSGPLGGTFPGITARRGNGDGASPIVAETGKLVVSPPLGPPGTSGGIIPSAQPGWQPSDTQ